MGRTGLRWADSSRLVSMEEMMQQPYLSTRQFGMLNTSKQLQSASHMRLLNVFFLGQFNGVKQQSGPLNVK